MVGSYVGGFGTAPGLKTGRRRRTRPSSRSTTRGCPADDGFVYNYYNAAWALIAGLKKSNGAVGAALQNGAAAEPSGRTRSPTEGVVKLDSNRQAIQDQYPLQVIKGPTAARRHVTGYVPNVDQSFGGLFKKTSPPPGRTQPPCVKKKLPWQGKILEVVKNGVITNQVVK